MQTLSYNETLTLKKVANLCEWKYRPGRRGWERSTPLFSRDIKAHDLKGYIVHELISKGLLETWVESRMVQIQGLAGVFEVPNIEVAIGISRAGDQYLAGSNAFL